MKQVWRTNYLVATLAIFVFVITSGFAQKLDNQLDSLIGSQFKDRNGPGGVFMVARNGKPIYQKAFGKANLELGVDLTPDYVFQLGSMTKQFTAIAILMLEEQGKLSVVQPISAYIPDYPSGDKITIHHLLTHTSGIKDFTKMKSLRDISQKEMTPVMMTDFFKNEPVDFAPGEKFDYNNSGYFLLGRIIEAVSGKTYEAFIGEDIFQKIGMTNSHYASDRAIISKRAYGYQQKNDKYVNKTMISYSIPYASGALMSTAQDILTWQNALNTNLLLRKESLQKAHNTYKLNSGEAFTYGYGWHIKLVNNTPVREHGGSIFGFKTMGVYVPAENIYVLGLTNCDCNSPTQLTRDITKLVLDALAKKK